MSIALAHQWADLEFAPLPLPENHQSIQASQRSVAVDGNMEASTIITGDENTLHQIDTGGGTSVQGDVTVGGDFVGHDKHVVGDEVKGDKFQYHIGQIIHQSQQERNFTEPETSAPGVPPYKGLQFFDVRDADIFYGREQLTAEIVTHLRHERFLAVVGASGSGKSSLVRAGLVASLQRGSVPGVEVIVPNGCQQWPVYLLTPGVRPLESLAVSLTQHVESVTATSTLIDNLRSDVRSLHLYVSRILSGTPAKQLLLVVDQFEELFTLCRDVNEQRAFVDALLSAALDYDRTVVVMTLRADFYASCARFEKLRAALDKYQKYIGLMSRSELQRAIEVPARQGQWVLEPELMQQMLDDVSDEPGSLPLLSHALDETWKRRRGRQLTLAGYVAAGGVKGAIAYTADETYRDFSPEQKIIARAVFLRLTELGEGVQDTRRRVALAELQFQHTDPEQVAIVLKALADARLVTTDADEVQVMHEAVIREWPLLRDEWLADDREGLRIHRRLSEAAQEWQTNGGNDANDLYRGSRLSQAWEWANAHATDLNQVEQAFLQASQAEADNQVQREAALAVEREAHRQRELENQRQLVGEQKQRANIFRNAVIVAGLLFVLALLAAGISLSLNRQLTGVNGELNDKNRQLGETNTKLIATIDQLDQTVADLDSTNSQLQTSVIETERNADLALSRQLSAQSTSELGKNHYELAFLLAIESGKVTDTLESFAAIRAAMAAPWSSSVVLYGHTGTIASVKWSQDESKILTAGSDDNTARIWDAVTGKELVKLQGHTVWVSSAEWNQDESKVLTTSHDGTVRIWDAATGKESLKLEVSTDWVSSAEWSQDESKILIISDNRARIWDAATGKELVNLEGVYRAVWSQDGSKVLINSNDGTLRIWDVATGKERVTLEGHSGGADSTIWNQDGSKILTTNYDNAVHIWDTATSKELLKLEGHVSSVSSARWNQDESKILTTSNDDTVRIWDTATGKEMVKLEGQPDWIGSAEWSQDESKILITNSTDHTVRIWDVATGKELVKLEGVDSAEWSQDGSKILTTSADNAVRIWDAASRQELVKLEGHTDTIYSVEWSQDESKIFTEGSSDDSTVRIWDAATGKELLKLEGRPGYSMSSWWSEDESKILTIRSDDNTARIWDTATGKELVKLIGVDSARWSPDDSKILTAHQWGDGTVRIWDVSSSKELLKLEWPPSKVIAAWWNQDGSKILTTSDDSTVRIWDAATGEELLKLEGQEDYPGSIEWSQDESKILTISNRLVIHLWDVATGKELIKLEGHSDIVRSIKWNQDGSKILTTSDDNTVRIWDAATGKELVKLDGQPDWVGSTMWSQDESKILTTNDDYTARIWDAASGQELVKLKGHMGEVRLAVWNQDESKILTSSYDDTVRIWDAATGKELFKLDGVGWAEWSQDERKILTTDGIWDAATGQELVKLDGFYSLKLSQDGSKILTNSNDNTPRIWYTYMADLLVTACLSVPRNFTHKEWDIYMEGDYRPTCPNAPIPPDAIADIKTKTSEQIRAGHVISGTQRLEQLNSWLQTNGQFKSFGVDMQGLVAQITATATTEVLLTPTVTPIPSVTSALQQPLSPLHTQPTSPVTIPTATSVPEIKSIPP